MFNQLTFIVQVAEVVGVPSEDVMDYFRQEQVETVAEFQDQLDNEVEMDVTNNGIRYVIYN